MNNILSNIIHYVVNSMIMKASQIITINMLILMVCAETTVKIIKKCFIILIVDKIDNV